MTRLRPATWLLGIVGTVWLMPLINGLPSSSYGGQSSWLLGLEAGGALALLVVASIGPGSPARRVVAGLAGTTWLVPELAGWVAGPGWIATAAVGWSRLLPALVLCMVMPSSERRHRRLMTLAIVGGLLSAASRIWLVDPFVAASCWRRCDHNPLVIVDTPLGPWLEQAGSLLVAGCAVAAGVLAVPHRQGARWPVTLAAAALTLGAVGPGVLPLVTAESGESAGYVGLFLLAQLGAIALALALLYTRLLHWRLRTRLLRLSGDLSTPDSRSVADALRRAARDPQLDVRYWAPERALYVDEEGWPVALPQSGTGRSVTLLRRRAQPVAALVHAPGIDGARLDRALGAALRLVLENERLRAATLAELHELRQSRARIVERATLERHRLERNLHDGAQQRVVSLSLLIRMVTGRVQDDPAMAALADQAGTLTDATVQELRRVARGIHPAVVGDAGLASALVDLAESSTDVAVLVDGVPRTRYSGTAETTAYTTVAVALADARSRGARVLTVCGEEHSQILVLTMTDDAVAAARNPVLELADQVEALGGSLSATPWRRGTRLRLELPCGS